MWSQEEYIRAYRFAALAHQGQTVPGTAIPYLMHLSLVSMEVIAALSVETGHDGDLAVACALLHDTLEDTAVTDKELRTAFGPVVAEGVRALSKAPTLPKAEQMADSLRRIRAQPREVAMVKLADRITNLQPPPAHWAEAKIAAYRAESVEILRALGEASPALAARLATKIRLYPGGDGTG
jgi:(p)ppGpp synthase/HD superfamily hydrolase